MSIASDVAGPRKRRRQDDEDAASWLGDDDSVPDALHINESFARKFTREGDRRVLQKRRDTLGTQPGSKALLQRLVAAVTTCNAELHAVDVAAAILDQLGLTAAAGQLGEVTEDALASASELLALPGIKACTSAIVAECKRTYHGGKLPPKEFASIDAPAAKPLAVSRLKHTTVVLEPPALPRQAPHVHGRGAGRGRGLDHTGEPRFADMHPSWQAKRRLGRRQLKQVTKALRAGPEEAEEVRLADEAAA